MTATRYLVEPDPYGTWQLSIDDTIVGDSYPTAADALRAGADEAGDECCRDGCPACVGVGR